MSVILSLGQANREGLPMPQISDEDAFECAALVYSKWAQEYDLLKKVKNETNDGRDPDYEEMHKVRLANHTATEAKWKALLTRMTAICPRLI